LYLHSTCERRTWEVRFRLFLTLGRAELKSSGRMGAKEIECRLTLRSSSSSRKVSSEQTNVRLDKIPADAKVVVFDPEGVLRGVGMAPSHQPLGKGGSSARTRAHKNRRDVGRHQSRRAAPSCAPVNSPLMTCTAVPVRSLERVALGPA
jgi:hypothetical protein